MSEIARSCTIVLADLFIHVDPFTDFPTEMIHANRLEQICQWLKSEDCFTAYGIDKIIGELDDRNSHVKIDMTLGASQFLKTDHES